MGGAWLSAARVEAYVYFLPCWTDAKENADKDDSMNETEMDRTAVFSKCRKYRYVLGRQWETSLPSVLFVALNPSTADASRDDATVRRCVGFARSWGFGTLIIANLFAFRSTDPRCLVQVTDPVGPRNDRWLQRLSIDATLTIAAWGSHGQLANRAEQILPKLKNVHHLGLTKSGHPRHPLYLPASTSPTQF